MKDTPDLRPPNPEMPLTVDEDEAVAPSPQQQQAQRREETRSNSSFNRKVLLGMAILIVLTVSGLLLYHRYALEREGMLSQAMQPPMQTGRPSFGPAGQPPQSPPNMAQPPQSGGAGAPPMQDAAPTGFPAGPAAGRPSEPTGQEQALREATKALVAVAERMGAVTNQLEHLTPNNATENAASAPMADGRNEEFEKALGKMTAELRALQAANEGLTKEAKDLRKENKELSKRLEEATAALTQAQAQAEPPKKKKKQETVAEKENDTPQVRVVALFPNGAVLADGYGKTATLEVGQSFHGYKIESVDFQKGRVKTSKGTLKYNE